MSDLYKIDELCMGFTNQEILDYFVTLIQNIPGLEIILSSYDTDNIPCNSDERIRHVSLDGIEENFFVSLHNHQISVFILNEEFMFIDDEAKKNTVSSDTYHNVVYEGYLRDKTHQEILSIVLKLLTILYGTEKIEIAEEIVSQNGVQYPKCNYIVKLTKSKEEKQEIQFENILFSIN